MAVRRDQPNDDHGNEFDLEPFFKSKRAAAVLKHAILAKYIVPFAAKTGSTAAGKRVVIVDGYAGAGRYEDGAPGSPALIADAARSPALRGRVVECHFVERDAATFQSLCQVLAEVDNGGNLVWEARRGNVEEHLEELLAGAEGAPLFLFLDPFGLGLPFDVVVGVFTGRPAGRGVPATEVLFRFDANAVRRIRGVLHKEDGTIRGRDRMLARLDRAAGGTWWRDEDDPTLDNRQYLDWFESRLLREITRRAECAGWITAVKQREDLQPAYLMVFLTRHRDGMEVFGETLSKAQEVWRRAVFDEAVAARIDKGLYDLFDLDEGMFAQQEKTLGEQLERQVENNIRELLRENERFVIRSKYSEVYAGVVGIARTTHLRAALSLIFNLCAVVER